jgi:tRNA G18 (ribose-2'-O)-methylase SpoU
MIGGVASLNAASASAVAMFEVVRQKATQEKSASVSSKMK